VENSVLDGIIVGAAGGAIAGLMLWGVEYLHTKIVELGEKRRVYRWLKANTRNEDGNEFRSTRAIASWTNLTEERARYICSISPEDLSIDWAEGRLVESLRAWGTQRV
jgi:hypothetical protein